jgi:hypothetical protein
MKQFAYIGMATLIVIMMTLVLPVAAQPGSFYENKYEKPVLDRCDGTGVLTILVTCHHSVFSSGIILQRVEQIGSEKLTYGVPLTQENLNKLMFVGPNITRFLKEDGTLDERFIGGIDVLVTLKTGNAMQPEYQLAHISQCEISRIVFIGQAFSQLTCDRYRILKASYGATGENCEQVCEQVIDVPAHDEYRYWIHGYCIGHPLILSEYICEHHPFHSTWVDGHWSEWSDIHPTYIHETRHVEATYKKVCHEECESIGSVIDVTSAVQYVVTHGHTSFKFDNRPEVGGIFTPDGVTLLYEIEDPAPGLVKEVHIVYNNGCGEDHLIDAMEYDIIELGSSVTPI